MRPSMAQFASSLHDNSLQLSILKQKLKRDLFVCVILSSLYWCQDLLTAPVKVLCLWFMFGMYIKLYYLIWYCLFVVFRTALDNMPPLSLTSDSKEKPAVVSDQMLNQVSTFLRNLAEWECFFIVPAPVLVVLDVELWLESLLWRGLCLSVCLFVTTVYRAKIDEWIEMPLGRETCGQWIEIFKIS